MLEITECQLQYMVEKGKVPGVKKSGNRWAFPAASVEGLKPHVIDKARCLGEKTRRAMFIEKAKNEYGMTSDAIRQMIHRGVRTPEGTPDWDALEAQLTRRSSRVKASEASEDMISLKNQIAACDELLKTYSPWSEVWEDVQEKREQLRQRLRGCHP